MKVLKYTIPAILFLAFLFSIRAAGRGGEVQSLRILVEGFRTSRGQAAVSLYRTPGGFPDDPKKAFQKQLIPIQGKRANCRFKNLSPGIYAVSVLHDENRNNRMDKTFWGFPKEGFGVSRNPKIRFSKPPFEECSFRYTTGTLQLKIKMQYL